MWTLTEIKNIKHRYLTIPVFEEFHSFTHLLIWSYQRNKHIVRTQSLTRLSYIVPYIAVSISYLRPIFKNLPPFFYQNDPLLNNTYSLYRRREKQVSEKVFTHRQS